MELSLKAEQKQILSQKMIQSAEILQMTAAQLEEYLNEQELENPVLELTEKEPEKFDRGELEKYQWICAHDEQNHGAMASRRLPLRVFTLPPTCN